MRLTLAQIHIEAGDVGGNVDRAADAIATAADHGADLVVLPEIFTIGYFEFDLYTRRAESLDGETLGRIRATAREYDVAILAGSIVEDLGATARADNDVPVPATDGLANTAVLFDREGRRLSVYRKHHLFGYGSEEADILVPGESLQTAELGGFDVGVTTCYDLRFPELYRRLAERGATLILVPGA